MSEETGPAIHLTDKQYNTIKPLVQIGFPAFASLYFGLSATWGFPGGEQVVGTVALITTFLGIVLGLSSKQYKKTQPTGGGQIVVTQDETGKKVFSLELDKDPEEIQGMKSVTFNITDETPS